MGITKNQCAEAMCVNIKREMLELELNRNPLKYKVKIFTINITSLQAIACYFGNISELLASEYVKLTCDYNCKAYMNNAC